MGTHRGHLEYYPVRDPSTQNDVKDEGKVNRSFDALPISGEYGFSVNNLVSSLGIGEAH